MKPRRGMARSGSASPPAAVDPCLGSGVTRESERAVPPPSRFDEFARSLLDCCNAAIGSASGCISISDESPTTDKAADPGPGGLRGVGDPHLPPALRRMREVVCRTGQVLYSNRFGESPWFLALPAGAAPFDNVLLAPLQLDAKTIGVLGLANKPGGFTEDDARRARQFGELAASGLELEREVRDRTADRVRINDALQQEMLERRRLEDEARQSRALIERIADATPDIVYLYDLERRTYLYINRRLTDVLGYEPQEFARDGDVLAWRIVHPEDRGVRAQRVARMAGAADGELMECEYRILSKGGEYRWLQLRETVFSRSGDGSAGQILGVARDITAVKRVERSVLEALEAERRRIGQDLHDGLGQVLTGVALVGKRLERRVEARTVPDLADVRQLLGLVAEAMGETKKIARGLFPDALEAGGLRAALEEHARDVTARSETLCVVHGAADPPTLSRFRAVHLFRIAQEAVHNAVRHGRAKQIAITLRERAEETVLEIVDDGAGIRDEDLVGGNGMGLTSMRYRARLIEATLDVRRHPDGGTILTCRLGEGSRPEESSREDRTDSRTISPGEVGPRKRHAKQ